MNFASPFFLFAFLPACLAGYFLLKGKGRAAWLLLFSLIFCLWAGPFFLPVALAMLLLNYAAGTWIDRAEKGAPARRRRLTAAVVLNVAVMIFFKALVVYAPPAMIWLQKLGGWVGEPLWMGYVRKVISLPTGISFYTFAVVAYLVDVFFARIKPAASLFQFSQFFLIFPKFAAGPIVRFQELSGQLAHPLISSEDANAGLRRFVLGLGKKVLIADRLGAVVDRGIFDQAAPNLNVGAAWMILLFYALQIYFDFSGYSDMAIGLARIFGFKFPENFNYPYMSRSISEFWRRWHMTLSGWFRDYVFYPLERRRASGKGLPQAANILIVFFLTGLWHGITVNFILWGLLHGAAIAFEGSPAGKELKKLWAPLQTVYALLVVLIAWVFFRSNTPAFALAFLGSLVGIGSGNGATPYSILPLINTSTWLAFAAGILFAAPVLPAFIKKFAGGNDQGKTEEGSRFPLWLTDAALAVLLVVSIAVIAGSTFQPYIYGNF